MDKLFELLDPPRSQALQPDLTAALWQKETTSSYGHANDDAGLEADAPCLGACFVC